MQTKMICLYASAMSSVKTARTMKAGTLSIRFRSTASKCDKMKQLMMGRAGSLVKIRPCNKEYGGKTYLGLYLGNQPWSQTVSYNNKSGELTVGMATNPAIYVFDLQRIIFGAESWWGIIESLEELKDITDDDINNI